MMGKRRQWTDETVERAAFVERTVREMCELLRANGPYPEVVERIERAQGALQSIRAALWQRELVRAVRPRGRDAA